ncbi:hypothetical protein HZS_2930 [Henneguya salminicola]|nr:hypothetical protein HZS_2930 [Henneguya salminicola]
MISLKWKNPNEKYYERYDQIFTYCLLEYDTHHNLEFLTIGLRLLFVSPNYLIKINEDKFTSLVNNLNDFFINQEEPVATYSLSMSIFKKIECLQIVAHLVSEKIRNFDGLSKLADILIVRIMSLMKIKSYDILSSTVNCEMIKASPDNSSYYDDTNLTETKQMEKDFEMFDLLKYVDVGVITIDLTKKFHHLAFLNYLIPLLNVSKYFKCNNIFTPLNSLQ